MVRDHNIYDNDTLNLYEYSDVPERKKDIGNHHCVIILFDMTNRQSFEDILDKWIKFLRQVNYSNTIILFGTKNYNDKDALPMTDDKEINDLIDVDQINGTFPQSFGLLSKLESIEIASNMMEGVVSEVHFANLMRLTTLEAY